MMIIDAAVRRIVASALVAVGVFVAGCHAYWHLGAAALPALDLPTIVVTGVLPGADPETMASTVATPLERRLGRLAGVTEISSVSNYSFTQITIQFAASRNIDGASTDVEAAINAAGSELPADMPSHPTYKRVNPAMAPVILIAMTSATLPLGSVYDFADSVVRQKLSEVEGVANVQIVGAAKSSVRIRVNAEALGSAGLSLDDVRAAVVRTSLRRPLGSLDGQQQWAVVAANDQLTRAADYRPLIVANRDGAVVRLSDVATVVDDVANNRVDARYNGRPALFALIQRKDGANIVDTIQRVRAELPNIRHWMPPSIDMEVVIDRADEIEATLADAQRMFAVTAGLVVALVLLFLGNVRAMLISVASIPISFAGTFVVMRALGYSLDTISLLGLTLAVAFVVDDAIVMVENIVRLQHGGYRMMAAALTGARQITFTIASITLSLVAAFAPFFLISGIIGALFREFAVTLCTAIVISAIVSLTLTPALCARFLHRRVEEPQRFLERFSQRLSAALNAAYVRALRGALRHQQSVLVLTIVIATLTMVLFGTVRRGFLPTQESGVIAGVIEGAPDTSFVAMRDQQQEISARILADPAVQSISSMVGSADGSSSLRIGQFFIALRPYGTRDNVRVVIGRLRQALAQLAGSNVYMVPIEDINVGGRRAKGQYQFTLLGDNGAQLERAAAVVLDRLTMLPELKDVGSDHEGRGLQIGLDIDRDKAGRIGLSPLDIDQTLYDAFGQRQIATIYGDSDQYQVVLEINAIDRLETETLQHVHLRTPDGSQVALRAIATMAADVSPLTVTHQGEFPAITLTFNLAPGIVLGQATKRIEFGGITARPAKHNSRQLRGPGAGFQLVFGPRAIPVVGRLVYGLRRAGYSL